MQLAHPPVSYVGRIGRGGSVHVCTTCEHRPRRWLPWRGTTITDVCTNRAVAYIPTFDYYVRSPGMLVYAIAADRRDYLSDHALALDTRLCPLFLHVELDRWYTEHVYFQVPKHCRDNHRVFAVHAYRISTHHIHTRNHGAASFLLSRQKRQRLKKSIRPILPDGARESPNRPKL